jgi:hypothetical protein
MSVFVAVAYQCSESLLAGLSLCSLFNISGDDLVNSWLAYSYNNKIDEDNITLARLDLLEQYLHEENQKKYAAALAIMPSSWGLSLSVD